MSARHHPYATNNPGAGFHQRDNLTAGEVKSWFGSATIRVLAGCAPCQPFSTYAQRYDPKGTERWGLLGHFDSLGVALRWGRVDCDFDVYDRQRLLGLTAPRSRYYRHTQGARDAEDQ
jgi:site-specific DNA-cytosine methylase